MNRTAANLQSCQESGNWLPVEFITFITRPDLYRRVPTCTACYLQLSQTAVHTPPHVFEGQLLRFMTDQQAVLMWYLLLRPDGQHCVVAGEPEWYEQPKGELLEEQYSLANLIICAQSFEEFIYRFWLEHTIWYALSERADLTAIQQNYVETATRNAWLL